MSEYKLQKGDVLLYKSDATWYNFFTRIDRFAAFLIKIGTFSHYAHTGILLKAGYSNTVGEALNEGFVIRDYGSPLEDLIKKDLVHVYRVRKFLTPDQRNKLTDYVMSIKGRGYDWKDILDIGLSVLTGRRFDFGNSNDLICSEAVSRAYNNAGLRLVRLKSHDEVTPGDIGRSKQLMRVY